MRLPLLGAGLFGFLTFASVTSKHSGLELGRCPGSEALDLRAPEGWVDTVSGVKHWPYNMRTGVWIPGTHINVKWAWQPALTQVIRGKDGVP